MFALSQSVSAHQFMLSVYIFPSDSVNSMGNHFYLTGSLDISALWTDIASGVS